MPILTGPPGSHAWIDYTALSDGLPSWARRLYGAALERSKKSGATGLLGVELGKLKKVA